MDRYRLSAREAGRTVGEFYGVAYGLSYRRILEILRSGELAGDVVGGEWFTTRPQVDRWISEHRRLLPLPRSRTDR